MVRAPCCEKMGLKKGPWTPEEDQILVNYIHQNGHGNWRALPKLAGLLRCGKSCRLRWTNYLNPGIKRGNFSKEEEDAIINLHQMLGNRWSAIAASLPGRTDNEIKNLWHTHLKKIKMGMSEFIGTAKDEHLPVNIKSESAESTPTSPPRCSSDSSFATATASNIVGGSETDKNVGFLSNSSSAVDESFWVGMLPAGDSGTGGDFDEFGWGSKVDNSMDFWFNVLTRSGELQELQEMMF